MKNLNKAAIVFLFIYFLLCTSFISALSITTSGGWNLSIDSTDVTGSAGSDLTPTYYSSTDAIIMSISDAIDNSDNWEIQVHKTDTNWHGNLKLALQRTSNGSGGGSISGGDSLYIELTGTDQYFFEGSGDRTDVDIQFRLTGVSVLVPADSYSTTIYFTVIDTP